MKYLIYLSFILWVFISCAPSKRIIKTNEQTSRAKATKYDERFDPLSLNDDDIVIAAQPKKNDAQNKKVKANKTGQNTDLSVSEEKDGFRVQIFASRNVEGATIAQQKAKERFNPLKQKVYWIFEAPFYKIRIGDALDRDQADKILELAKSLGYDQAFIVRSKVTIVKSSSFNND